MNEELTKTGVTITEVMSKTVNVTTLKMDKTDTEQDLEMLYQREYYTIPELLKELRKYVVLDMNKHITRKSTSKLEVLLLSTFDWTEDELTYTKN